MTDIVDLMTEEEITQISNSKGEQRRELWNYIIDKYISKLYVVK
jgi:hypothetical protein